MTRNSLHLKTIFFLRLALAAAFLSAVADRFGLWGAAGTGEVGWGDFSTFVSYTGLLLWFLPKPLVQFAAWAATILEVVLAVALLVGYRLREVAFISGLLLLSFAISMTFATGPEGPFTYSVWTAAAASMLLATHPYLGNSPAQQDIRSSDSKER